MVTFFPVTLKKIQFALDDFDFTDKTELGYILFLRICAVLNDLWSALGPNGTIQSVEISTFFFFSFY